LPTLFATKRYARSEIGRALSDAPQFAHVTIEQLFSRLDSERSVFATPIKLLDAPKYVAVGYDAGTVLWDFSAEFGTLCPVCLCAVYHPTDFQKLATFRREAFRNQLMIPAWLHLERHDEFQPVHNECAAIGMDISRLINAVTISQEWCLLPPRRVKKILSEYHDLVSRKALPSLRFNPRKQSERGWYHPIRLFGTEWRDGDIVPISEAA